MFSGNGCPLGWVKVGCSCYYEYTIVSALQKSQEDCEKKGGNLIVVNSIEKQVSAFVSSSVTLKLIKFKPVI